MKGENRDDYAARLSPRESHLPVHPRSLGCGDTQDLAGPPGFGARLAERLAGLSRDQFGQLVDVRVGQVGGAP